MGRTEEGQLTMTDFTFEAFLLQAKQPGHMAIFASPEDLGAVKSGQNYGIRPASMWHWEQLSEQLQWEQVQTSAFYQFDFGTDNLIGNTAAAGACRKLA